MSQGTAWVAIFFILLGFVNSLKPVKQARAGATEDALSGLAVNGLRRTSRLVLPAATVTVISWFLCQLGAYRLSHASDAYWLRITSPDPSPSFNAAFYDLFRNLFRTWTHSENAYDQPQWALFYLFKGSMYVLLVLVATVNFTPKKRMLAEAGLYAFSWMIGDCLVGFNVYAGMILAELSFFNPLPPAIQRIATVASFPLAGLGLYLCSYPNDYTTNQPWSAQLLTLGEKIFPSGTDIGRFWPGVGAQLLCLSILFSPPLKRLFSQRYLLWLGSVSYPIYLLHGPMMRSVLSWITFALISMNPEFAPALTDSGSGQLLPLPRPLAFVVILPLFGAILLSVVHVWGKYVEPRFGRITKRLEDFVTERERNPAAFSREKSASLYRKE